jgi:hypothetical protein
MIQSFDIINLIQVAVKNELQDKKSQLKEENGKNPCFADENVNQKFKQV